MVVCDSVTEEETVAVGMAVCVAVSVCADLSQGAMSARPHLRLHREAGHTLTHTTLSPHRVLRTQPCCRVFVLDPEAWRQGRAAAHLAEALGP